MAVPSPLDIWNIILSSGWLLGALLSVSSAALQCVGLILQKKAQYRIMGDKVGPLDPKPSLRVLLRTPLFWLGLILFMAHSPVNMLALLYAPETTVTPLNATQVMLNFFLSYGVLYERFKQRDITATLICIVSTLVMNSSMPQTLPGYMENFPLTDAMKFTADVFTNVGFAAYMLVWVALFATCLYVVSNVSVQNVEKPLAIPLLVGLLYSQGHFFSKIAWTLMYRSEEGINVWAYPLSFTTMVITGALYAASVYATCEGLRQLSCRFFVPAVTVASQAMTVTQLLLFFRTWESMTNSNLLIFVAALLVSLIGLLYISPEQNAIPSPSASGLNSPLLCPKQNAIQMHQCVLAIMDEYNVRKPTAPSAKALETLPMDVTPTGCQPWRLFPITVCCSFVLLPAVLLLAEYAFFAFTLLTIFGVYQGWKLGAHIALFAYVGIKKMAHFENADFKELHAAEVKKNKQVDRNTYGPKWKDVIHFVILPNYKEDTEVLRLAIRSVAASGIAKQQIGLILAMEVREEGAREKAELLTKEFQDQFLYILSTHHPPGIAGEMPGKSSNTKWAAQELFHKEMPRLGLAPDNAVITVADADSEFHPEYFAALSYYFINAGGASGETPERHLTIWQPPILHYKNYLTQPAIVRLASFITSQHELANLSDPNATRVPYSTYSISASLAKAVNGWDPDWISEDWHMALKCFFATGGRLKITPIFFAVMNYAPAGDTFVETLQARWTQAKRHALGFSEMVYFGNNFSRILYSLNKVEQQGKWRQLVFIWRASFLWIKLLMIHLVMAVFFVVGPLNGILIAFFAHNQIAEALNINSWTFLVNCVFQSMSIISFSCVFVLSVMLYEAVKDRVDGTKDPRLSILWRAKALHFITVIPQSLLLLPLFFVLAGVSEWIAAAKTAKTHVFHYEVASKPKLSSEAPAAAVAAVA